LYLFINLLFQNHFKTAFQDLITPGTLLNGVIFLTFITTSLVVFTYLYLGLKKRSFFFKDKIRKSLELWISHVILSEEEDILHIPEKFAKMFRNPVARQYAIDHLIINKKVFSGAVAQNIRHLYEKLGFKNDSLKKLHSKLWYTKAKGIQELSIMDQNDQLIKVYRLTNSRNDLVRNEAQNAIIQWSGFNGLRFLDVVTYDISEWQQIQLLEFLKLFTQQDIPKLTKWLSSKNNSVILFALKLAEVYQQFGVKEKVEQCLLHEDEKIRIQAVNTLARVGDSESADHIIDQYKNETIANQLNILQKLPLLADDKHLLFLQQQLLDENDFIKLSAARALGVMHHLELVKQKADEQPEPYEYIFKHVKADLSF
jgi:hypothetical protein